MNPPLDRTSTSASQDRPSAAKSPRRPALSTRLAILVALSVAVVVTFLTIAGVTMASRQLDMDLRETARLTAVALADDIELTEPPTPDALLPVLRDFMSAAVDLYAISVYSADGDQASPIVSTTVAATPPRSFIRQVMSTNELVWDSSAPHIATVGVPIRRGDEVTGMVAVAVSLTSVERLRRIAGLISIGGTLLAIATITLLINLLARRLVLEPLGEIRRAIARARTGDLKVRAALDREDEMKEVADGLNAMLTELDDLHQSLNQRVADATDELRQRNDQLLSSYRSVMQLRETAARTQQLATVGQTMANVAHQIGTPLNLVSGHVQLLLHEVEDPSLRRRLEIVDAQVQRVVVAVRDLLDRARPHHEKKAIDMPALLERLGDAMRPRLASTGVTFDLRIPPDIPLVVADETQMELALLNLVTNALDAMPEGGTLILVVEPVDGSMRIEVRDTGPGIPPDVLSRIFEPWVTTKPSGRGSGLGLSIARDVIAGAGGTIAVSSTVGQGTVFTITLPQAPSEAAVPVSAATP